jgi:hypothetical protein
MPVKQSASKEEFLKEIGLGAAPAETRDRLFGMMWVSTRPDKRPATLLQLTYLIRKK